MLSVIMLMSNKVIFNLDELFISVGIDVGADFSWMSITLTLQSISVSRNGEAKNPVLREYYLKKCDSKPKLVAMGLFHIRYVI